MSLVLDLCNRYVLAVFQAISFSSRECVAQELGRGGDAVGALRRLERRAPAGSAGALSLTVAGAHAAQRSIPVSEVELRDPAAPGGLR
eukprot:6175193-Pleurochrysis_carterae.AAC.2